MANNNNRSDPDHAALPGWSNFRDLGGHRTRSGKTVREGLAFRSGNIAAPEAENIRRLQALGIASVCDFRSAPEHVAHPNLWIGKTEIDYWRWGESISVGDSVALLEECCISTDKTVARMQEVYRQIPYEQADSFRELFIRLAARKTPILFHCAAGKDRTGVAAALLLSLLDVSRPHIFEDFTLTNDHFKRIYDAFLSDPRHEALTSAISATSNEPAWVPMLRADPRYLEAMFDHLETAHGGVERYLEDVLGIDPQRRASIRDHLLE